jgi:hypothetical protein
MVGEFWIELFLANQLSVEMIGRPMRGRLGEERTLIGLDIRFKSSFTIVAGRSSISRLSFNLIVRSAN